jgi:hypothetical protein
MLIKSVEQPLSDLESKGRGKESRARADYSPNSGDWMSRQIDFFCWFAGTTLMRIRVANSCNSLRHLMWGLLNQSGVTGTETSTEDS